MSAVVEWWLTGPQGGVAHARVDGDARALCNGWAFIDGAAPAPAQVRACATCLDRAARLSSLPTKDPPPVVQESEEQ